MKKYTALHDQIEGEYHGKKESKVALYTTIIVVAVLAALILEHTGLTDKFIQSFI